MKRRNFMILSSLATAAVVIPKSYFNWTDSLKLPVNLTNIFGRETIIWIGEDYLKRFPNENNIQKLTSLISKNNLISLEKKIKEDYKTDRVAVLNGWILSITEGRQCALYSLTRTI